MQSQGRTLMVNPTKQQKIERSNAFSLGEMKRGFEYEVLYEGLWENADETSFACNIGSRKTHAFIGDKEVKYADVVSGGEPVTMTVRLYWW